MSSSLGWKNVLMNKTVVVGDVGGTNSRWAIYNGTLGPVTIVRTRDTRNVEGALSKYLHGHSCIPDAVCVGVAGPVVNGTARLTNVDWSASEERIEWPARIINDIEAVAHAVPELSLSDVCTLRGLPAAGTQLVIGVGTGFGGAMIEGGIVSAMEPGHEPLLAHDQESEAFLLEMRKETPNPTIEDVVSGRGFELALAMLGIETGNVPAGKTVLEGWGENKELAWVRRNFLGCFGHTVGRLAVRNSAVGGVFLTGGVVGHWFEHLSGDFFLNAAAGALRELGTTREASIQVITHEFAGLLGAGTVGQSIFPQ
jgi:glucokinase